VSSGTKTAPRAEDRDLPLDGLRGLAILCVVLSHSTFEPGASALNRWLTRLPSEGWVGVDLFFVLSGFLITRILVRERGAANYFRAFYARRFVRIFPLYYALLAIAFWVVPRFDVFEARNDFWVPGASRATAWYWLYLSNLETALRGGFQHRFLGITWSLAIEEQFYLTWPLLVWWLPSRRLVPLCVAVIGVAFLLRCGFVAAGANPYVMFVGTPFRCDALACGALVALLHERDGGWSRLAEPARWILPAAGGVFLALLALFQVAPGFLAMRRGVTFLSYPLTQTIGYSALAAFGAALLVSVMAAPAESRLRRGFEWRPLRWLGHYSYAIYLVHTPVVAFTNLWIFRAGDHDWPLLVEQAWFYALVLALSGGVALVSWYALEGPALRLRRYFPYRSWATARG
jgi:peptidoglycan/LPS O-acetylase OafA/YrhL